MTHAPTTSSGPDGVGMELVRLKKSMEAFRVRVAGGQGLEGSGLAVLFHLVTGGPARTTQLAELLGLDPSTTSRHVAALERSGHVQRVADPDDGRAWLVQASSSGHRAFADTRALRNALLDRVLSDWDPADVHAFAATLARFNDAVLSLDDTTVVELAHLPPLTSTRPTTPRATSTRKDRR